jgi:hypothetical protein
MRYEEDIEQYLSQSVMRGYPEVLTDTPLQVSMDLLRYDPAWKDADFVLLVQVVAKMQRKLLKYL